MHKNNKFNLIMISAMYENGGNTLHRFLDGHPQLFVYPFESQPGTSLVSDYLTSIFPQKYRWGEFSLSGDVSNDYELIIDEEFKRHVKTPFASKFKDADMRITDQLRKKAFLSYLKGKPRSRAALLEAYFVSTFDAWKDYNRSGNEIAYVGYSPIIGVDAEKIFTDFPSAKIVHIVRNPYSAYADTKKRPVPPSISRYMHTWSFVQLMALNFATMYPKNFYVVRFEDMVANPKKFFTDLSPKIGIRYNDSLLYRSWNGKKVANLVPWGTVKFATSQANKETMEELSKQEYSLIKERTHIINKLLSYDNL